MWGGDRMEITIDQASPISFIILFIFSRVSPLTSIPPLASFSFFFRLREHKRTNKLVEQKSPSSLSKPPKCAHGITGKARPLTTTNAKGSSLTLAIRHLGVAQGFPRTSMLLASDVADDGDETISFWGFWRDVSVVLIREREVGTVHKVVDVCVWMLFSWRWTRGECG